VRELLMREDKPVMGLPPSIDRRTLLAGMGVGALAVPDARAAATTRV
jgi:hypothetical protein